VRSEERKRWPVREVSAPSDILRGLISSSPWSAGCTSYHKMASTHFLTIKRACGRETLTNRDPLTAGAEAARVADPVLHATSLHRRNLHCKTHMQTHTMNSSMLRESLPGEKSIYAIAPTVYIGPGLLDLSGTRPTVYASCSALPWHNAKAVVWLTGMAGHYGLDDVIHPPHYAPRYAIQPRDPILPVGQDEGMVGYSVNLCGGWCYTGAARIMRATAQAGCLAAAGSIAGSLATLTYIHYTLAQSQPAHIVPCVLG
jgi:hypothetical protein